MAPRKRKQSTGSNKQTVPGTSRPRQQRNESPSQAITPPRVTAIKAPPVKEPREPREIGRKRIPMKKSSSKKDKGSREAFKNFYGWLLLATIVIFVTVAIIFSTQIQELYHPAKTFVREERSNLHSRPKRSMGLASVPTIPTKWPSIDQTKLITGEFLSDPLVTNAMAIVKANAPAALLAIPPSTYVSGSTVKYLSDPTTNCYWPYDLCVRTAPGAGVEADVYTCPNADQWGISYDDGPTVNVVGGVHKADTTALRKQLDDMKLKATFFVTGSNSFQYPEELSLHVNSGHQLASHSWSHHPLTSLTNEQIVAEIKYTEAIVYKATGKIMNYLRPPYGDVDDRVRAIANALGYRIVLWDQDSNDTSGQTATVHKTIEAWHNLPNGLISLEHDISSTTTQIAIDALKAIQAKGTAFTKKIQAIATCNNHPFYASIGENTSSTSSSSTTSKSLETTKSSTTTVKQETYSPVIDSKSADKFSTSVSPASSSSVAPIDKTSTVVVNSPSPQPTDVLGSNAQRQYGMTSAVIGVFCFWLFYC